MKKGFTLIELLAVIVILAIIAVIAVPIILNVIEDSKKKSVEDSALGYVDAVEKSILNEKMKDKTVKDGTYYVGKSGNLYNNTNFDEKILDVLVKGTVPSIGSEINIKDSQVVEGYLTISNYPVTYDNGKAVVGKAGEVSVRSVSVSPSDVELEINKTLQLNVNVLPESATDKSLKWVSSNEEIATISDTGIIKGVGIGTTTITASTSNGKTAKVNVKIAKTLKKGDLINIKVNNKDVIPFYVIQDSPVDETDVNVYMAYSIAYSTFTDRNTVLENNTSNWVVKPHIITKEELTTTFFKCGSGSSSDRTDCPNWLGYSTTLKKSEHVWTDTPWSSSYAYYTGYYQYLDYASNSTELGIRPVMKINKKYIAE